MEQTEQVEQTEGQPEIQDGGVGASLMSSLFAAADDEPEQTSEPPEVLSATTLTDALQSEPEMETEAEPEPEPEPEAEPEEVEKMEKLDASLFESSEPKADEPESQPEPEPEPDPVEPEPVDGTKGLTEDQLERLELVEFAEKNFEEHKGLRDKYIEFFKDQKEYIEARLQDDPDALLDETDHDYQAFLKRKRPKFDQKDATKVIEKRTRQEAKAEAIAELTPELEKLKEEQRQMKILPRVQAKQNETRESIKKLLPEHMRTKIESDGLESAYESNPMEYDIVNRVATMHQESMNAYHEISLGLVSYNPENPVHVRLATWVDGLQSTMPPVDEKGRKFVPREDFVPGSKNTYTLTDEMLVSKAEEAASAYMNKELNALEERLRKAGFTRNAPASQPEVAQPKLPKPAPRQGHTPEQKTPEVKSESPVLKALGL